MNTFSNALRAEVVRMARKEIKPELQGMRKAITRHRSEIAALKRDVKTLTSELKAAQRNAKVMESPKALDQGKAPNRSEQVVFDFQPEMLAQMRSTLGITQVEMGLVLGVSSLSVARWEKGQAQPRSKQLAKIEEVVRMGPVKAARKLRLLAPVQSRSAVPVEH